MSRIRHIAEDQKHLNAWARRVFTRLEWGNLSRRFTLDKNLNGLCDHDKLYLSSIHVSEKADITKPSPQRNMLQFLAGRYGDISAIFLFLLFSHGIVLRMLSIRWAAKEAVIKAHRYRKVFMPEISIIHEQQSSQNDLYALVNPPSPTIVLDEDVARMRGLRGCGPDKMNDLDQSEHCVYGSIISNQFVVASSSTHGNRYLTRRERVKAKDSQRAEVSISHDGDYAIAMCMAADETVKHVVEESYIVDDGSGDPIHEPVWGDEGWLMPVPLHH